AVPLVTTATRLPRAVYLNTSSGFAWIARQASATPGVYASERCRWVESGLVATTSIFPGRPPAWYSRASVRSDISGSVNGMAQSFTTVCAAEVAERSGRPYPVAVRGGEETAGGFAPREESPSSTGQAAG